MTAEFEPRIVAFLCNWCTSAAADLAGVSRFKYPSNILPVRVMCSGMVDPFYVMYAFKQGADGVLMGGCHIGDCHYLTGNWQTQKRVPLLKKLLESLGIDPRRLRLEWISASEGARFVEVAHEFVGEIKQLGPNPLKGVSPDGGAPARRLAKSAEEAGSYPVDEVRRLCKEALAQKKVDVIYGLKEENGDLMPHFFQSAAEIDHLGLDGEHRLFFTYRPINEDILALVQKRHPELKIGLVARGCDERALFELAKRAQVKLASLEIIGVACDQKQAAACRCATPYPLNLTVGTKVEGIAEDQQVAEFLKLSLDERLAFWSRELAKCVKCYGCRNSCPVCACTECRMEQECFMARGFVPPEFPLFHFVQFMHHADRCTDCGECEHACPMDIPLRLMKKIMRAEVGKLFNYVPGADATHISPFATIQSGGPSHDA